MPYINAGVKKVVCSFPLKEPSILNIVVGVNDDKLTADMPICTAASCTTNCLAPVVKVVFRILADCVENDCQSALSAQGVRKLPNVDNVMRAGHS